jgi:TldD protein
VDMVGTPLASFEKILATGDDDAVFNGFCGAESGYVPVSAIAPSLLVGEIEVERKATSHNRSPLLPPPLHPGTRWSGALGEHPPLAKKLAKERQ